MNIDELLAFTQAGETAIIKKIKLTGSIKRRLLDIGLISGTKIECVNKSPSGDPAAYEIRGAVIAIRKCDAEKIVIEKQVN